MSVASSIIGGSCSFVVSHFKYIHIATRTTPACFIFSTSKNLTKYSENTNKIFNSLFVLFFKLILFENYQHAVVKTRHIAAPHRDTGCYFKIHQPYTESKSNLGFLTCQANEGHLTFPKERLGIHLDHEGIFRREASSTWRLLRKQPCLGFLVKLTRTSCRPSLRTTNITLQDAINTKRDRCTLSVSSRHEGTGKARCSRRAPTARPPYFTRIMLCRAWPVTPPSLFLARTTRAVFFPPASLPLTLRRSATRMSHSRRCI